MTNTGWKRSEWQVFVLFPASAVVVCLGVFLFTPVHSSERVHAQPVAGAYADPASCLRCHAGIAQTYQQTGMGRSFHRMGSAAPIEDFASHNSLYNLASDRHYTMVKKNGSFFEQRFQIGFEGKETTAWRCRSTTKSVQAIMRAHICTARPR